MAHIHQFASIFFRLSELGCSVIVLAILGRFLFLVDLAERSPDGRLIYASVTASIALVMSMVLMPPLAYSFYLFPIDIILFIMYLVAFCLMETLVGVNTCQSNWYFNYWGPIWSRSSRTIRSSACKSWRVAIGFTFIASMLFLASGIMGMIIAFSRYAMKKEVEQAVKTRGRSIGEKQKPSDLERQQRPQQLGPQGQQQKLDNSHRVVEQSREAQSTQDPTTHENQ